MSAALWDVPPRRVVVCGNFSWQRPTTKCGTSLSDSEGRGGSPNSVSHAHRCALGRATPPRWRMRQHFLATGDYQVWHVPEPQRRACWLAKRRIPTPSAALWDVPPFSRLVKREEMDWIP
jgi:Ni/Co efflux regulator RcnB